LGLKSVNMLFQTMCINSVGHRCSAKNFPPEAHSISSSSIPKSPNLLVFGNDRLLLLDRRLCGFLAHLALDGRVLFGELVEMRSAPFSPEPDNDGLHEADGGGDEKRAEDTEEFGTCDEGCDGDDGVEPDGLPDYARTDNVAFDGVHRDEVEQHNDGEYPGLMRQRDDPAI
jgi:hypothetical protein